jgi:hypothetical protein
MRGLHSKNACHHSVQNLLSSCLLCKNFKIAFKTTILPLVLYGCETWSLVLMEGQVLGRIRGPKMEEVVGGWTMGSFVTCTLQHILLG